MRRKKKKTERSGPVGKPTNGTSKFPFGGGPGKKSAKKKVSFLNNPIGKGLKWFEN